jgi:hypothetical protein
MRERGFEGCATVCAVCTNSRKEREIPCRFARPERTSLALGKDIYEAGSGVESLRPWHHFLFER